MKISQKGINLIKECEGFVEKAYKCCAGKWTIGYGHTKNVKEGEIISLNMAEQLLRDDLKVTERIVNSCLKIRVNQNQYDALCSLCFNIGGHNFLNSTVLRMINEELGEVKIKEAWRMWNKISIGGVKKVNKGLVNRREKELNLYFK